MKGFYKDIVVKDIYHYLYEINENYYFVFEDKGERLLKDLGSDYKEARSSFFFFSMELCGVYDIFGYDEYKEWCQKYLDSSVRRMSEEEIEAFMLEVPSCITE